MQGVKSNDYGNRGMSNFALRIGGKVKKVLDLYSYSVHYMFFFGVGAIMQ